jgi:DNA-binding Lrp family transcriptional regulator
MSGNPAVVAPSCSRRCHQCRGWASRYRLVQSEDVRARVIVWSSLKRQPSRELRTPIQPVGSAVSTARNTRSRAKQEPQPRAQAPVSSPVKLDETDLRILEQLTSDARTSQRAIARAVGMSAPAVAERILRLEAAKVIVGYRAVVDWAALGRGMTVHIDIISERSADQRALARKLLGIPEVELAELLTGPVDIRLRLRVRDHAHLRGVYFDDLLSLPEIRHTNTSILMYSAEPDNHALAVVQSNLQDLAREPDDADTSG